MFVCSIKSISTAFAIQIQLFQKKYTNKYADPGDDLNIQQWPYTAICMLSIVVRFFLSHCAFLFILPNRMDKSAYSDFGSMQSEFLRNSYSSFLLHQPSSLRFAFTIHIFGTTMDIIKKMQSWYRIQLI